MSELEQSIGLAQEREHMAELMHARARRDAFEIGARAGFERGEEARGQVVWKSEDLNGEFDRGVTEGIERAKQTPLERLQIVLDEFGSVDPATIEDLPAQVTNGHRFVTVTRDDDDDHYLATYETLDQMWDGLADEIYGERSWWPHAIYDLHTGESIGFGVKVTVYRSDDPGATVRGAIGSNGIQP